MELQDLKIISELIHKYGIKAFEEVAEAHSLFLDYMQNNVSDNNSIFYSNNNLNTYSKFYENETSQIFTNCKNSIYCFKPKIINFDLLKTNTNNPIALPAKEEEIKKYLDNAKKMLGENPSPAYHLFKTNDYGTVIGIEYHKYGSGTESISLEDYKLIRSLLKNIKIYVSKEEPIIHFEGENGYAYVLGRNNIYKSIF